MKLTIPFLFLALLVSMPLSKSPTSTAAEAAASDFDLIIRNGRVIDGSGGPSRQADLAIKGNRIARIGDLKSATATRVIDARGLVVAPGFIDMLGQSETVPADRSARDEQGDDGRHHRNHRRRRIDRALNDRI